MVYEPPKPEKDELAFDPDYVNLEELGKIEAALNELWNGYKVEPSTIWVSSDNRLLARSIRRKGRKLYSKARDKGVRERARRKREERKNRK